MSHELLYTSAARGLKPGSRGFCTVVSSQGIPAPLESALEALSTYRHVYRPGDPEARNNPVLWSHVRLSAAGRQYSVLSRISDYQLDYSDRSNKLAHHVALEAREQTSGGPAWNLGQAQFMESSWDGMPRVIPTGRPPAEGSWDLAVCTAWQRLTGDAGWAGVLAESFLSNPDRHVYIEFSPGMDLLPLMIEAIGLIPRERRWEVTFSTFFTNLPPGVVCNWRCVLADSAEAIRSRRSGQALRIDLCEPLPPAIGGALVDVAKTGRLKSAASFATEVPPNGSHRQFSVDNSPDDLELETLKESAPVGSPDVSEVELENAPMPPGEPYGVENRSPLPPGMPPPPPPSAGTKRRRLEALHAEDARGGRQWLTGVAVALALMFAGVGFGMWMRSGAGTPSPKEVAVTDGADHKSSDRSGRGSSSDTEGDGPDDGTDDAEQNSVAKNATSAAGQGKTASTSSEYVKKDSDRDQPVTDSNSEKELSESTTKASPYEGGDETPDVPRPGTNEFIPRLDGKPLLADRSSSSKSRIYYLDAVAGRTLDVPVRGKNVSWDLHLPNGFSGFEVDRTDSGSKLLFKRDSAGREREPAFIVTEEPQGDRLLLTFQGGNADPDAFKWCVISVSDEKAAPLLFALQSGQLGWDVAEFKSGTCKKSVPQISDNIKPPLLQAASVVVRLVEFDRSFGFEVPSAAQKPPANASLCSPDIEDYIARDFSQVPANVGLEMKQESGSVTLTIKGLPMLDNALKKRVDSQIKELNRQPGVELPKNAATKIENEWKQKSSAEYLGEVETTIAKRINDLAGATQDAANTPPTVTALRVAHATIAGLRKAAEQFFKFKKSLQEAEITAASFYYEVAAPNRKQPTKIYLRFSKGSE